MWNNGWNGTHMFGADGMGWGWFMGLHGLFSLLVIGLIIAGVVFAVRAFTASDGGGGQASDVLAARYADGQISREEYLQRRRDLETR